MQCLKCGDTCKAPVAPNWKLWQLCYKCAIELHPEYYKDKKKHGVGGTWMRDPTGIPMTTPIIKNT